MRQTHTLSTNRKRERWGWNRVGFIRRASREGKRCDDSDKEQKSREEDNKGLFTHKDKWGTKATSMYTQSPEHTKSREKNREDGMGDDQRPLE